MTYKVPKSVQVIAEVIGLGNTLLLLEHLPRCYPASGKGGKWKTERLILYVPKRLHPDHRLVEILGWTVAQRLVQVFGGEVLMPANCATLYRQFRDQTLLEMLSLGIPVPAIARTLNLEASYIVHFAKYRRIKPVLAVPRGGREAAGGLEPPRMTRPSEEGTWEVQGTSAGEWSAPRPKGAAFEV